MSKYKKLFDKYVIMICRCKQCQPIMCQVVEIQKDTYCSQMACQKLPTTTVSPITTTTTMIITDAHSYTIILSSTVLIISILIVVIVIIRKRQSLITNTEYDFENMNLLNNTIELAEIHF